MAKFRETRCSTWRQTSAQGKLRWQVPAGKWRVLKFTHKQAPGLIQVGGSQLSVDGASKDCVDWYLQTVYQPHYDRYGADFGKTIRGFFYDEPETPGDWGTELNRSWRSGRWTGKKPMWLTSSSWPAKNKWRRAIQYLDAFAEAWGRTMYGGITQWCRRARRQVHRAFHGALPICT